MFRLFYQSSLYYLINSKPFDSCWSGDALSSMGSGLDILHFHTLKDFETRSNMSLLSLFIILLRLSETDSFSQNFASVPFISRNSILLVLYVLMKLVCTFLYINPLMNPMQDHPSGVSLAIGSTGFLFLP